MGSLKAKIRLEDGSKITAILGIDVEINIMIQKIIEDAGLATRQGLKLELISHNGHNRFFWLL